MFPARAVGARAALYARGSKGQRRRLPQVEAIAYLEFQIRIEQGRDGEYPVTVTSALGHAQEVMRLPFDPRALEGEMEALRDVSFEVARGEVVLVAGNRLAYKRWSGKRGAFHVPGPLDFLRAALDPRRPERSLAGYRRRFTAAGAVSVRSSAGTICTGCRRLATPWL